MKKLKFTQKPKIMINKDTNTIDIHMIFPSKYKKEEQFKIDILSNLLSYTTKEYPIEKDCNLAKIKKLIIKLRATTIMRGTNLFFIFQMQVPREGITKDFSLDDAFEMFVNTIYNPNADGKSFNKEAFDREIVAVKSSIESAEKNIYNSNYDDFLSKYDETETISFSSLKHRDLIDEITPENLYEFYKKIISGPSVNVVYGNTTKKRIIDLYKKYDLYKEDTFEIEEDYWKILKPKKKTLVDETKVPFNQSAIYYGYKVNKYKKSDAIYISVLCNLLDGPECKVLFNKLRIENQLVYHFDLATYTYCGSIIFEIFCSKHNRERVEEVLRNSIELLKDKSFLEYNIPRILKGMEYSLAYELDNDFVEFSKYMTKLLNSLPKSKELMDEFKKVDLDGFIDFVNRMQLDTICFKEGEKDE